MMEQCNCKSCRARAEDKDRNNAPVECGVDCDCITINGEKMCKEGRMESQIDSLDKTATLLPSHEVPLFFPQNSRPIKATNYEPESQYIFYVETSRAEDEILVNKIVIHCLDLTFGKSKIIKVPIKSYREDMIKLIEVIDEHRPTQIFFDESGMGVGLKDEFISMVEKSYIAMKVNQENGTMHYYREA